MNNNILLTVALTSLLLVLVLAWIRHKFIFWKRSRLITERERRRMYGSEAIVGLVYALSNGKGYGRTSLHEELKEIERRQADRRSIWLFRKIDRFLYQVFDLVDGFPDGAPSAFEGFMASTLASEKFQESISDSIKNKTIIGVMISVNIRNINKSYALVFGSLILYIISVALLPTVNIEPIAVFVIVGLLLSLYISQAVLAYRIRRGYYGGNEYEARELIRFIIDHSNKKDFIDKDGTKRMFPLPEASVEGEIPNTVPGGLPT